MAECVIKSLHLKLAVLVLSVLVLRVLRHSMHLVLAVNSVPILTIQEWLSLRLLNYVTCALTLWLVTIKGLEHKWCDRTYPLEHNLRC